MGYYIRFIHNRDLAAENIARAAVRSRFVLDAPPGAIAELLHTLGRAEYSLPSSSILAVCQDIKNDRGELPGAYTAELKRTRRNNTPLQLDELAALWSSVSSITRRLDLTAANSPDAGYAMKSGVWLNGRQYRQGDHIQYTPIVPRRGNLPGPGGREGSATSRRIATVNMFYDLQLRGGAKPLLLVDITERTVVSSYRSLLIIDSIRADTAQVGFNLPHGNNRTLIHLDAIDAKVKLVPHFDKAKCSTLMMAIPMWEAV